jgi:hypothetical protein
MSRPPIGLPSDIANSLQYLDDADLHRLEPAVAAEIAGRKHGTSTGKANEAPAPPASRPVSSPIESTQAVEIPEGKANLVRAAFEAGLKPPTIARTFGVPVSLVNGIIRSTKK